jgi:hypothetical protein
VFGRLGIRRGSFLKIQVQTSQGFLLPGKGCFGLGTIDKETITWSTLDAEQDVVFAYVPAGFICSA